ncbi:unnamed protein product [Closterium sp. NIES-64]|nr:unnamed protein product [Closterium sp. NIES-64]
MIAGTAQGGGRLGGGMAGGQQGGEEDVRRLPARIAYMIHLTTGSSLSLPPLHCIAPSLLEKPCRRCAPCNRRHARQAPSRREWGNSKGEWLFADSHLVFFLSCPLFLSPYPRPTLRSLQSTPRQARMGGGQGGEDVGQSKEHAQIARSADAALLVIDATPGAFEAGMGGGQGEENVGQSKEHAQIARSLEVDQLCVVADAALLVIDATPGAFEAGMGGGQGGEDVGQSKEHAQIARSLGVEQLCVVVNKMDATGFEQGEFERIKGVLGRS